MSAGLPLVVATAADPASPSTTRAAIRSGREPGPVGGRARGRGPSPRRRPSSAGGDGRRRSRARVETAPGTAGSRRWTGSTPRRRSLPRRPPEQRSDTAAQAFRAVEAGTGSAARPPRRAVTGGESSASDRPAGCLLPMRRGGAPDVHVVDSGKNWRRLWKSSDTNAGRPARRARRARRPEGPAVVLAVPHLHTSRNGPHSGRSRATRHAARGAPARRTRPGRGRRQQLADVVPDRGTGRRPTPGCARRCRRRCTPRPGRPRSRRWTAPRSLPGTATTSRRRGSASARRSARPRSGDVASPRRSSPATTSRRTTAPSGRASPPARPSWPPGPELVGHGRPGVGDGHPSAAAAVVVGHLSTAPPQHVSRGRRRGSASAPAAPDRADVPAARATNTRCRSSRPRCRASQVGTRHELGGDRSGVDAAHTVQRG